MVDHQHDAKRRRPIAHRVNGERAAGRLSHQAPGQQGAQQGRAQADEARQAQSPAGMGGLPTLVSDQQQGNGGEQRQ